MTEQARLYGTVLYELKVPEKMVRETGRIFQENPELKALVGVLSRILIFGMPALFV